MICCCSMASAEACKNCKKHNDYITTSFPTKLITIPYGPVITFYCKCGNRITEKDNYCSSCGAKVDWSSLNE